MQASKTVSPCKRSERPRIANPVPSSNTPSSPHATVSRPPETWLYSTVPSRSDAADDNTMSYANIMASYYAQSAYHYDSAAEAPYLTLNGQNGQHCTYVTY